MIWYNNYILYLNNLLFSNGLVRVGWLTVRDCLCGEWCRYIFRILYILHLLYFGIFLGNLTLLNIIICNSHSSEIGKICLHLGNLCLSYDILCRNVTAAIIIITSFDSFVFYICAYIRISFLLIDFGRITRRWKLEHDS